MSLSDHGPVVTDQWLRASGKETERNPWLVPLVGEPVVRRQWFGTSGLGPVARNLVV